jgi:hypothetical protein
VWLNSILLTSSFSKLSFVISVLINHGATAFILILRDAYSIAKDLVRLITAALVVQYDDA